MSSFSIYTKKNGGFMAKTVGKHSKKEAKTRKIPIFRLISIIIILACGIYIWNWVIENNHSNEVMQIAKEAVTVKKDDNKKDESKEVITPCEGCRTDNIFKHNGTYCLIKDWKAKDPQTGCKGKRIKYIDLLK